MGRDNEKTNRDLRLIVLDQNVIEHDKVFQTIKFLSMLKILESSGTAGEITAAISG